MKQLLCPRISRPGKTICLTKTSCLQFETSVQSWLGNGYGQLPQCHELCPASGTAQAPEILLVSKQRKLKEQFQSSLKDIPPFRLRQQRQHKTRLLDHFLCWSKDFLWRTYIHPVSQALLIALGNWKHHRNSLWDFESGRESQSQRTVRL